MLNAAQQPGSPESKACCLKVIVITDAWFGASHRVGVTKAALAAKQQR